jgi:tRNA dimethylallyltransferase
MIKTVIIAGPTATGKTDLAIKLAKLTGGVIINADSRQVYLGMDIGTNKGLIIENGKDIKIEKQLIKGYDLEQSGISGYLFNILKPDQAMDLFTFQQLTYQLLDYFDNKGVPVFLTGGTGLYLDAIIKGYILTQTSKDLSLREELAMLELPALQNKLSELDSDSYLQLNNSDRNNPRRLIRLIEKALSPTLPMQSSLKVETLIIYPKYDRESLYKKIEDRVELMIKMGLIDEVIRLRAAGYRDAIAMQGIGYREINDYLDQKGTLDDCAKLIKVAHRNYAKRQITWFEAPGRDYQLHRFDFNKDYQNILKLVETFLIN